MKTAALETNSPDVRLVEPDIERDARLGVKWLQGETGRATLSYMGVADKDNKPSTLEYEKERIKNFIERNDQLNWMIEYQNQIVGSIWVDLEQIESLAAPSIHIMIGDIEARGKGIGYAATNKVIEWLKRNRGAENIYSRYLISNHGSRHLLTSLGFEKLGESYTDKDGLKWQNVFKREKI